MKQNKFTNILISFKKTSNFFSNLLILLTIIYLIISINNNIGNYNINIISLIITTMYLLFKIVMDKKDINNNNSKKLLKKLYKWSKLLIKALTLFISIYGIIYSTSQVNVLSLIITIFMINLWILQVLSEVIVILIKRKINKYKKKLKNK